MSLGGNFYLGSTPYRVRWLSDPRDNPVHEDIEFTAKLYVAGCYNSKSEADTISIGAIVTAYEPEAAPSTSLDPYGELAHAGGFNDLQVVQSSSSNNRLILTASTAGTVARVKATFDPQTHELTAINDAQPEVVAWLSLPRGSVASVDVWQDAQRVLAVGDSGAIAVSPLEGEASGADMWKDPLPTTSYSQGRWTDSSTFVTAGTAGGLQCWDTRAGPKPTRRSPPSWGPAGVKGQQGEEVTWLAVHPSRPNICATGSSTGSVVLWDLRLHHTPVAALPGSPDGPPVWEVAFDTADSLASTLATPATPLFFCTEAGRLCRTVPPGQPGGGPPAAASSASLSLPPAPVEVIADNLGAINSFHVEPVHGQDLVYVTDRGGIGYIGRDASQGGAAGRSMVM